MLLVLSSEKWKSSNKQESRYHTSWNLFTLLYSFLFQALNIFGFIQVSFMAFSCLLAERYTLFKEFGYHPKEFLFTFLAFATPKPLFSSLYWLKLIKTFQTLCFCSSLLPSTSTHYYIASFHFFFPNMQMIPNDPFSLSTSLAAFTQEQNTNPNPKPNTPPVPKKKRNLPGTPGILFLLHACLDPLHLCCIILYCIIQQRQRIQEHQIYSLYFQHAWILCIYII